MCRNSSRIAARVVWLGLALCLSTSAFAADVPESADVPILQFSETPGALEGTNAGARLSLYADGTLVVVRPPSMRGAGRHVSRLAPAELETLLDVVLAPAVVDFDPGAVRSRMRAAGRTRARSRAVRPLEARHTGDATVSALTIREGRDSRGRRFRGNAIRWRGVARDAEDHPAITELRDLDRARRALRAELRRRDPVHR